MSKERSTGRDKQKPQTKLQNSKLLDMYGEDWENQRKEIVVNTTKGKVMVHGPTIGGVQGRYDDITFTWWSPIFKREHANECNEYLK